jgi:hypothetical protein
VEEQNFTGGERKIEVGTLCNHANQPFDGNLFLPDFVLANPGLAARRPHTGGEDSHRSRFARAVGSEQTEDLSG